MVYIGRIATEKNLAALLEQFAAARHLVPDLYLALIGKGANEEELRELAEKLQLGPSVQFRGIVPYDDVPNWLAAADAFVTASTSEVHPLTVIEAMAAGKPVAAVHSPGISDSVESGVNGYLAATCDSLDAAIVALMTDPARTRAMGEAARAVSARFDIHRTIGATVELYEDLLQTRPDLRREREHGRWARRTEKWGSMLDQLAELIWPSSEDVDSNTRGWWAQVTQSMRKQVDE
jgi:glycosyltransferase involved in cell wall biosynthesis